MFLIRTAFWLSVVVLLLPADPETGERAPRVHALEALAAARTTVTDLSAFCDRNPGVCVTSGAAFEVLTQNVKYGARLVSSQFSRPPADANPDAPVGDDTVLPRPRPTEADGSS